MGEVSAIEDDLFKAITQYALDMRAVLMFSDMSTLSGRLLEGVGQLEMEQYWSRILAEVVLEHPNVKSRKKVKRHNGIRLSKDFREVLGRHQLKVTVESDSRYCKTCHIEGLKEEDALVADVSWYKNPEFQRITEYSSRSNYVSAKRQTSISASATLQMMFSIAESFLGNILAMFFKQYHDRYKDKTIEIARLESLQDIDFQSILDMKAEDHAEEIMRGGLESISDEICKATKVSLKDDCFGSYWETCVEAKQRRNVYVHNAGIANRQYCNSISESLRDGVVIGELLVIDGDYLKRAASCLEGGCIVFALRMCQRMKCNGDRIANYALDSTYLNYIKEKRWIAAEIVMSYFLSQGGVDGFRDGRQEVAFVNYWLAKKMQGRFDVEGRKQVGSRFEEVRERNDVNSVLIGHKALLDENEWLAANIDRFMLGNGEFTWVDFADWPVLQGFRESDVGKAFIDDHSTDLRDCLNKTHLLQLNMLSSERIEAES